MGVISPEEKGLIFQRMKCIGVPAEISDPLVRLFFKWADASGIEWTIQRWKDIKVDFLRKKGGLPKCSSWVKAGKDGSFFGGPFGSLETWGFRSQANFRKTTQFLNLYTTFFASNVTSKQAKKFISGVTAKAVPLSPTISEELKRGIQLSGLKPVRKLPTFRPLLSYIASPSKRAPTLLGSVPESAGIIDSIGFLDCEAGNSHLLRYLQFYKPILVGLEPEFNYVVRNYTALGIRSNPTPKPGFFEVGRIGLIQEPGYKLRAVANPGRVFQKVLEPFGKVLFDILKNLPWDCTFNQDKADIAISTRLAAGKFVHSVDLTGATDYFPLVLQEAVLRHVFQSFPEYVDLFLEISQMDWSVPSDLARELGSRTLRWSKGQPLGLFPSFASFALTHGILLLGLLGREYDDQFFILGDDVVILDDDLYHSYRDALRQLDCPVSESKTLSSTIMAEFRSILFFKDDHITQFKWRRLSDDSFVDIVRSSPNLRPLLLPRQRKVVDIISGLPIEFGGCGWNPGGISLDIRIKPFMDLILQVEEPKERLMGYNRIVNTLIHESKYALLSGSYSVLANRRNIVGALDQRAVSLVHSHLGRSFVPLYEIMGGNLDLVLNSDVDLPLLGTLAVSKVSRLQRWETSLGNLGLLQGAEYVSPISSTEKG